MSGIYILEKLISLPALLIAITFHEVAHGYTAYLLGDPTAKNSGRLSLNPLKHIDPIGFIMLLILRFGWAKPVPINPLFFKNRKVGVMLVSIAGPITNFMIAIVFAIIISFIDINNSIIMNILELSILFNIILGIFNLLPFPPLDGSKILASFLPYKYERLFYNYENYLYVMLIILIVTGTIGRILYPLVNISYEMLNFLIEIIYKII